MCSVHFYYSVCEGEKHEVRLNGFINAILQTLSPLSYGRELREDTSSNRIIIDRHCITPGILV